MTNKSYYSYNKVFNVINNILKDNNLDSTFKGKYFITDLEKSLRNVIKEKYSKAYLEGCFFHFIKALWKKAKMLGLCGKKALNNAKLFYQAFKIYPFINEKEREKYLDEIKTFIIKIESKKEKYLKFYLTLINIGKIQIF